ncbi:MAG: hypothetical protein LBG76_10010 [Treponema sp.]|nr:hypothetical protein [Treponema sp.]
MMETAEPVYEEQEEYQESSPAYPDDDFHSGKIYCANCMHCKLLPLKLEGETDYVLRIRCAAGKWKKRLGQEKMYKYSTITRRYLDTCDAYDEMGNTREFIRDLKKTLPNGDKPFTAAQDQDEE